MGGKTLRDLNYTEDSSILDESVSEKIKLLEVLQV